MTSRQDSCRWRRLFRVALSAILWHLSDRSHVGDEQRSSPSVNRLMRHRRIGDAIRDHVGQRRVIRRVLKPRTIQAGGVAAGAADTMAFDAHALEEPPAAVNVGGILRADSRRRGNRDCHRASG
jgi:hypothetical protein